jgi:hypothetical protein
LKENEWKKIIKKYNSSDKTKSQWCKENNLHIKTFSHWYNKLNKKYEESKIKDTPLNKTNKLEKIETNFVEVEIETPQEANIPNNSIKVTIGNAIVEVKENFNKNLFKDVIQALTESC